MSRALLVLLVASSAMPQLAEASPYRWPLDDDRRIVTAFYDHGGTDWRCGSNTYSGHRGTDIGVPRGTPVYAALAGSVKFRADGFGDGFLGSTDGGGFGNHVAIYHGDGDETIYAHMTAGSGLPALGSSVACADGIGATGNSGNSSGPHLHFETRVGVDPNGSYYSGSADDPYAGDCGGPLTYWVDQVTDRPTTTCSDGTVPGIDDAVLVTDVTFPDGTEVVADVPFVKTWRLRNTGTRAWGAGYSLVHVEGPDFGAAALEVAADPGAEVDVSLTMTASGEGLQRSIWRVAKDGAPFGEVFWVEVVVVTTPTTDADQDGFGPSQDCDDNAGEVHPGAEEQCDGIDNDCDGLGDADLVRSCCETGTQTCTDGEFGTCSLDCEPAGDGGCSTGSSPGWAGLALVLLALSRVARRGSSRRRDR
jgi:murein DD-endopeptidase MepM/ murein hydrolase activator NlpD